MVETGHYCKIKNVCNLLLENNNKSARSKLDRLILNNIDINTSNKDLLMHIIASSLLKRVDRKLLETKNIYLQKFDIPQIELFYEMAKTFPQVAFSHNVANQYLLSIIKRLKQVTILEIGIGRGKQICDLIKIIKSKKYPLQKINIIGVDPDIDNLDYSKKLLLGKNNRFNFEVNYYSICKMIENFAEDDYSFIKQTGGTNLLINSSYTLHHISHPIDDNSDRTKIFKNIRRLNPILFTIIEPNSNHDTDQIEKRLKNCWEFFDNIFDLIDQADSSSEHKYLVKEKFFGREIRDMFGVSDFIRTERHEKSDSWILKLHKAGFKPYCYKDINIKLPEYCNHNIYDGHTSLEYKNQQLVAVLAYQPY